MKASPEQQSLLLTLQALDTRLAQIQHRVATLPAAQAVAQARLVVKDAEGAQVRARTAARDLSGEVAKAESDVTQVRDRAARNQSRLDSGVGTAKDLQALQHELELLARRQADLEEVQLDVMERADAADHALQEADAALTSAREQLERAEGEQSQALGELEAERETVLREREALAPQVDPGLLGLYDKITSQRPGASAGLLASNRCGACGIVLNATDLSHFRAAPADEVLRCEECRAILVRPTSSGS